MISEALHRNNKIPYLNQFIFYIIYLIFFITSCEDVLEKPDTTYAQLEKEDAIVECINSSYKFLHDALPYYNFLSIKSDDINVQSVINPEIIIKNTTIPFTHEFEGYSFDYIEGEGALLYADYNGMWIYTNCPCQPKYEEINLEFYRSMYRAILMSNKIITDLNVDAKRDKWKVYLGEAYFLRAYLYFKLARIYGRFPLVTDIIVNYDLPLAQFTDIYKQIESDLIEAISYLPDSRYTSRKNAQTPHVGTAKVLLAEVYLTMGGYPVNDQSKYTKAAQTAREVIENAELYGFGLMEDFANLWQWQHHDNKESVWSIYYHGETFSPDNSLDQTHSARKLTSALNNITTEKNFFRNFPNGYRKEISFWHYRCVENYELDDVSQGAYDRIFPIFKDATYEESNLFYCNVVGKKQVINFSCYNDSMIKTSYPPYRMIYQRARYALSKNFEEYKKYESDSSINLRGTSGNIYNYLFNAESDVEFDIGYAQFFNILRYAHTLLTYAEASARSGNPDELAYECLNRIRRRALKLPLYSPSVYDIQSGLSSQDFADSVVAERGWEFCHEFEGRWNDIIRLQLYPEIEAGRNGETTFNELWNDLYNGQTYFIPLPDIDVWLNPNLKQDYNN